jgi:hypothetical protein
MFVFHVFPIFRTCPAHLMLLDFIVFNIRLQSDQSFLSLFWYPKLVITLRYFPEHFVFRNL